MNPFSPDAALEIRRLREWMPDRRERIATAALAAILTEGRVEAADEEIAEMAVAYADALIAELDKPKEAPR